MEGKRSERMSVALRERVIFLGETGRQMIAPNSAAGASRECGNVAHLKSILKNVRVGVVAVHKEFSVSPHFFSKWTEQKLTAAWTLIGDCTCTNLPTQTSPAHAMIK